MMAKNIPNKRAKPSLEDRFAFIGDAVAPGDQRALKSTLYEVEDKLTGATRWRPIWERNSSDLIRQGKIPSAIPESAFMGERALQP